jgi:DNA-binding MarR family transcriptional regulator
MPVPSKPSRGQLLAEVAAEAPRHAASAVRLNIAIAQKLGMGLADVQCMGLLMDGPAAPSDLAARLGLTTGAMTKVLDRLQAGGYITRSSDPADRRRVRVDADPEGLAGLAALYGPMGERMNRVLDSCSTDELRVVLSFMKAGREAADAEITRIREQGVRHATRRPARS